MKEAVDILSNGKNIAMLHFSEIFPFPATDKFNYLKILSEAWLSICIENNATGQFARLVRAETGFEFKHKINKYDGRPFLLEELVAAITGQING
ncbi:MAG: 2-oxoglutarate oxidoreductase, alpha subunit [Deltaproteobacteria bacterium]|nr:2-oxoglutarate oxidoreductase, alpha subunit [Deltaproteobacteria bacterium]